MISSHGAAHRLPILKSLKYPSGLYAAARKGCGTGYEKAWLRDNVYVGLGLEAARDWPAVRRLYEVIFTIFKKHEWKIDWAIRERPRHQHEYLHARYHPETLDEFSEEWGNKQNDAIGALIFHACRLVTDGRLILSSDERRIVAKLIDYLFSVEYWHDADNGIWEEAEEVHASSIGACVAGLKMAQRSGFAVPAPLVAKGEAALRELLPRESATKEADLALLSLIWPYDIVEEETAKAIVRNVEGLLVRRRGVIRYPGDRYYSHHPDAPHGREAEWTMGLPWLAIVHRQLGNEERAEHCLGKAERALNAEGHLPELYYAGSGEHNENSPLAWAEAMLIVALEGEPADGRAAEAFARHRAGAESA